MLPETAVAALACSRIGAVYLPMFSGYGAEAVAGRLRDAEAKLLITADGFYRRGRQIRMKEVADAAADQAPSVERVLVVPRLGIETAWREGRDVRWQDALGNGEESAPAADTDADEPFMVIYTSGTTGPPKGAVHVHAGFPVKAAQDMAHSFDLQPGDTLFWLTDMGWVMGPLSLTAALLLGATTLLYDGAPDFPEPDRIWAMAERHRVTHLGLSPTLIRSLMTKGDEWVRRHDRSALRVLGSTGEPWTLDAWLWYFRQVGGECLPIVNYSGGTEATGGILTCTTVEPIKACSFAGPAPGMDAAVLDEEGKPVAGRVGELAVRQPWVGMTQGFWKDPDRYLRTYWERVPGTWVHGDWALRDPDGFWYILGRSDDTLKVAGKRVGPAEVESAALSHPAVRDAVAVGLPHAVKGEALAVFVVLRDGALPDESLREEIRRAVGYELGKALLPDEIRFVADLPRTRNGKLLRRLVRASYLGQEPGDVSSLDNPDALRAVRESA
jgi:acetyl-CoA synthetase